MKKRSWNTALHRGWCVCPSVSKMSRIYGRICNRRWLEHHSLPASGLAARAIERAALADAGATNGLAVTRAGLAGFVIYRQFLLKIARAAVDTDIVAQCRAAGGDGVAQHLFYGDGELVITRRADAPGRTLGVNAGSVQRFRGINIADADHHVAVHDEG